MSRVHRLRDRSRAAHGGDAAVPARRRPRRLYDDPQGGRARRQDSHHLRPARPARHQPGRCRAAAAAAGRDPVEVGRQRQGDALDRLRGRRLRAARVRGGLRFQGGARRCPRQGRPGEARPAARRRRAVGAGGQPLGLSGAGGRARRRPAGAHAAAHRPFGQERHRAGARGAAGGAARRPRRGGRGHRRADAARELRHRPRPARPAHGRASTR